MNKKVWVKSSYSGGSGGNCLEVSGSQRGRMLVRDTQDRSGPMLSFTVDAWKAFAKELKSLVSQQSSRERLSRIWGSRFALP